MRPCLSRQVTLPFLGSALGELLALAPPRLKRRLALLLVVSIFGGVAEMLTVGAVIPLLVAASDPARLGRLPLIGHVMVQALSSFSVGPVVACAILLSVFGIAAAAIRLLVLWLSQDFVYGLHRTIVVSMYSGILFQPYEWFTVNNGADFVATIDKVFAMAANMLVTFIAAVPALLMSCAILLLLFFIDPTIATSIVLALGLVYFALTYFVLHSSDQISRSAAALRDRRARFAQETWGAARDIIIDRNQPAYLAEAANLENQFAELHVRASLIGLAPRIIVDVVILLMVSVIITILARTPADLVLSLPLLAAFAIGGQRLIPLLQQVYLAYANQQIYRAYAGDALAYTALERPQPATPEPSPGIDFNSTLELRNVSFHYAGRRSALRDVNLSIRRGSKIGIAGRTGSGKTTLADIILGLIAPSQGEVLVDGVRLSSDLMADWHAKIAHVPQTIFLADGSLLANIAFAERDKPVDPDRALRACIDAGLADLVSEGPDGLNRKIGERGIQLSGGQRQRIGIARALYKGAELMVLDEATSALDPETEQMVLESIFTTRHELTIFMISHRPGSLKYCDEIVRLSDGQIVAAG